MENSLDITQQDFRDFYLQHETNNPIKVSEESWYIREPGTALQGLCDCCKYIDFEALFNNAVSINFGPVLVLQDMIANYEQCSFCRLALNAMCSVDESDLLEPESEGEYVTCHLASLSKGAGTPLRIIGLFRRRLFQRQIIGEVAFLQEIQNDVTPFGGRLVSPYQADINLLRGWLNTCERDHRDSPTEQLQQHSPLPTLPQLRAIDVHEQRIVQIGRESRFVALSYVWGGPQQLQLTKSNHEELSQRGSLLAKNNEQKLPQTIKDAAFLVSLLKERYLWVDALCIIQDGPGKQEQIQNMDSVYASAVLALVAASGEDANAGMLRIRPREKCHNFQQQFVTSVKGLKLANTLPDLSRTVDISIWNSRAWTYQERVLSKRLLFVSEGQTYFRCVHGDTFVEDLAAEHSPQGYSPPNPQIRGMEGTSNFEVYALAVENYGNRNLSFNDDAINAMAGILSYLRP